jgi:hypothetical protein
VADDDSDVPEFVGNRQRSRRLELGDHVKYKGKVYTALTVKRLTAQQVTQWADAVRGGDVDALLGNVVDDDGQVVPKKVLDFLDDDDDLALNEAMSDFLPRRLSESLASDSETPT